MFLYPEVGRLCADAACTFSGLLPIQAIDNRVAGAKRGCKLWKLVPLIRNLYIQKTPA